MANHGNIVRFDWAIKKLLRNKANYDVLEGFLSVLLGRQMRIQKFLESESNKMDEDDKFNRVDILVEDEGGELIIIEVQNDRQLDYFQRMHFGTAKTTTEYLDEGQPYSDIKKIYSINIVYFSLGQGDDYVYKGGTNFVGIHSNKVLELSKRQKELFRAERVEQLFPEYWLLRVNEFNDLAKSSLDEWISFLKTGDIDPSFQAQGLQTARQKLLVEKLPKDEQAAYRRYVDNLHYQASMYETTLFEGFKDGEEYGRAQGRAEGIEIGEKKGRAEGISEGIILVAKNMKSMGLPDEDITKATGLSAEEIAKL